VFGPHGVNERLLREAGFELVMTEDLIDNESGSHSAGRAVW
jgi:hypothetical protein